MSGTDAKAPGRRVLLLLATAYVLNFLDRNIIGILALPIRTEFNLSDTALGQVGVAFGLVYAIVALPIARLADRKRRVDVIAGAVAVWSLFTAACGLASTYAQLIAARMGVAAGEAGGIAPSYALISDHYPPAKRSRALALFSLGIPIGSALGIFFGGWIASALSWQSAFLILGLAGLPLALMIKLMVPEAERGRFDPQASRSPPNLREVAAALARLPGFWLLSVGAALGSIPGYGLIFWLPSFFHRSFALPLEQVSWFYGSIMLVGGVAGTLLGGWIGERSADGRPARLALIPAVAFLAAIPTYLAGLFAPNLWIAWPLFALAQMLTLAWLGPVVAAIQQIVAPSMRATASATFLFVNNLIGIAGGIYALGWMSDALKATHGEDSLRYSILYVLIFYLLSALIYLGAARALRGDNQRLS
jgi:predicted MFS family arabinose efflux permease